MADSVLRQSGWLAETPPTFQELVLDRCDALRFETHQDIYDAGDDAGGIYGVVEGGLEVHLPWIGSRSTLSYVGGSAFWTGAGTATTGRRRRVALAARASSYLLRLPRAQLASITREYPSTLTHFAALTAETLFLAIDIIKALKREDAVERLGATLLNMVRYPPRTQMQIHLSQSDLAAIAGMARSSVSASIASLEQRGWIRRHYAVLEITNLKALERFIEGDYP